MSADYWAVCPRCLHKAEINLVAQKADVRSKYGKVSIEEWEELAPLLAEEVDEEKYRSFREDYEFYGVETGILEIRYSGECTDCGLKFKHDDTHTFWSASS